MDGAHLRGGNNAGAGPTKRGRPVKHQPEPVDAVAQAGRFGPVLEDVPHRSPQRRQWNFRTRNPDVVSLVSPMALSSGFQKLGHGAAVVFGSEEKAAGHSGRREDALALFLQQRARTGRSVPCLRRFILLRRKLCAPFGVGLSTSNFQRPAPAWCAAAESGKAKQAGDRCERIRRSS